MTNGRAKIDIWASPGLADAFGKPHASVLQKLDLKSRVQAVVVAYESGVVTAAP